MAQIANLPKTVYKYRTWYDKDHKKVLTHNELYFASPSDFGLPDYECRLRFNYGTITEADLKNCFRKEAIRIKPSASEKYISEFIEYWLENTLFNNENHRKDFEIDTNKELDEILGVLCLCLNGDNEALWDSDIGNNHRGYCVGFDTNILTKDSEHFGIAGNVNYYDSENSPKIIPFQTEPTDLIISLLSLPVFFQEEKEFRCLKLFIKDRIAIIPNEAYKEIILGVNMSEAHKKEIAEIANSRFPNAQLLEAYYSGEKLAIKTYNRHY